MKHTKRTLNAWENFWDRVYHSDKARNAWNKRICPAIEYIAYGAAALFGAFAIYAFFVILALAFPG